MGVWIDEDVYNYILAHGGEDGVDVEKDEDGECWFLSGDWEEFGLQALETGIFTISERPSQDPIYVGNYEG